MVVTADGEVCDGAGIAAFEEWREKLAALEQIARAVHENNAEWEAWNERRMQAEERGEPFDEPLPSRSAAPSPEATERQ